jgi:hypothetical protein
MLTCTIWRSVLFEKSRASLPLAEISAVPQVVVQRCASAPVPASLPSMPDAPASLDITPPAPLLASNDPPPPPTPAALGVGAGLPAPAADGGEPARPAVSTLAAPDVPPALTPAIATTAPRPESPTELALEVWPVAHAAQASQEIIHDFESIRVSVHSGQRFVTLAPCAR